MPTFREAFPRLVSALDHRDRPGRPAENRTFLERLVACYWERIISAKQAETTLRAFEGAGLSDLQGLAELDPATLRDLLAQEGLNVPLRALAPFVKLARRLANDFENVIEEPEDESRTSTDSLRDAMMAISGIGRATADDILLRVFGRAAYPLDRATYRILLRHGWIDSTADYDETADLLIRNAEGDPNLLAGLSVWFDELGHSHCRSGGPRCERCPLQPILPEGGPMEGEP